MSFLTGQDRTPKFAGAGQGGQGGGPGKYGVSADFTISVSGAFVHFNIQNFVKLLQA